MATNFWQDRRIRSAALSVLVLLSAFLLAQTINSVKAFRFIGADVPAMNVVTVTGKGEVFAVPDIASFTFSVIEERASAAEAQTAAAEKINRVLAFVKERGVEDKDIKTINFNLFPRYEFRRELCRVGTICPPSGKRELVGFEVNQGVQVKVRDTDKAGELVAGVTEIGASSVSGLSFTIDDEEAIEAEARAKAIEDARAKAESLAEALDVRLVRIVNFNEFDEPVFFAAEQRALGFGGDASASIAPDLPSGENKIVSQVNIAYEIR